VGPAAVPADPAMRGSSPAPERNLNSSVASQEPLTEPDTDGVSLPAMWAKRHTPNRGLLAGLLALVAFASGAVAITAKGSPGAAGAVTTTQSAAAAGDTRAGQRRDDDGATTVSLRDEDALFGERGGRHR
jgi:hypothetical protein